MIRKSPRPFNCRVCQAPISEDFIAGSIYVCPNCHYSGSVYKKKKANFKPLKNFLILLSAILVAVTAYFSVFKDQDDEMMSQNVQFILENWDGLNVQALDRYLEVCTNLEDYECRLLIFKKYMEIDPEDIAFLANYAYVLTEMGRHKEALPLYEEVLESGEGTYDLMGYYGKSLKESGHVKLAIKWFTNALAINPRLIDVTKDLALTLVQDARPFEAASLLKSFMSEYSSARGELLGNLISIQETHLSRASTKKKKKNEKIRLLALSGGHHFVPIGLGPTGRPQLFMIDTGATLMTMDMKSFVRAYPKSLRDAQPAKFLLANGKTEEGKIAVVPEIRVGAWKLKNIEVGVCNGCELLVGKSVLKHFGMKTEPYGNIERMELVLQE